MKKRLFLWGLSVLIGGACLMAQSARYPAAMKANFKLLHEATTMQEHNSVAAAFQRIASAEKTLWVPYYYAALAKINGAMHAEGVDKDLTGQQVDSLLLQAEGIERNSELSTLHYYNEILKMSVNPAERFMQAAPLLEKYYKMATMQDSTNPRIYFLRAQTLLHTPESFGGGKKAAHPLFQKVVDLFTANKAVTDTATDFRPTWGEKEAEAMLKATAE